MSNQEINTDIVISQSMPQFIKIAAANKMVAWEEESQFAMQSLTNNRSLRSCSADSVTNAIINVAAVGLTLNPADGYAYLVPEYDKQQKQNVCRLRISFKGLIKAATDTGVVEWVKAETVRQADDFKWTGVAAMPVHNMNPFGDRGELVGVYCVAKLKSGEYLTDVMSWDEVMRIKGCAKTQSVWNQWPEEMAKKAIIKRAAKQWPKSQGSQHLHKAIEVINDSEGSSDPMAELERVADAMLEVLHSEPVDLLALGQIWCEQEQKEQATLWTAKTKGGWFTMDEKALIRQADQAYKKANQPAEETQA